MIRTDLPKENVIASIQTTIRGDLDYKAEIVESLGTGHKSAYVYVPVDGAISLETLEIGNLEQAKQLRQFFTDLVLRWEESE